MPPEERNKIMNLTTHKERRLRGDLVTIYKNIDDDQLFTKKATTELAITVNNLSS